MAGLTDTGFQKKTLLEVKDEVETSLKLAFGEFINLLPESVFGQVVGIFSERESLLWDLAEEVYDSAYPDTAYGASLDNVVAITGTQRDPATKSRVQSQILFGTAGSTIPAGTIFSVAGNPLARFLTDAPVTLVTGVDEVQRIAFTAVPDAGTWKLTWGASETAALAFNASAAAVQAALQALVGLAGATVTGDYTTGFAVTFSGVNGKQNQPTLIASLNSLTHTAAAVSIAISETTAGVPQGSTTATAQNTGPNAAAAGTLTVIETPVTGLTSTKNLDTAAIGSDIESDADLRLRREDELQNAGSGTVEAVRAAVRRVTGVTQAIVFENDTNIVDLNGQAPHSLQVFAQGGTDQAVRDAIWAAGGGGIYKDGTIVGTIVDSQGITHTVRFSRPVVVPIYVNIKVTKDSTAPTDLAAQVRNLLATYLNGLEIGQDIIVYPTLIAQLTKITGIIDVQIGIATTPAPALGVDDNIIIAVNSIASVINPTSDIAVTVA